MRSLLLFLTVILAPCLQAQNLSADYRPYGQLIITQLVSAPFPHPARAKGHTHNQEFFPADKHYQDNSVAIFIPKNFRNTSAIDLVVHFHGWRHHLGNVLPEYQLIEQFVASGRNAILIVPQGPYDAPDSFGGKLEDADGFKRFIEEVLNHLPKEKFSKPPPLGRIILSGHSGGYQVIASILARGGLTEHVREVWLFDALYSQTDKFAAWFQNRERRFIDIYTENGGTKSETEKLMAKLKANGTPFFSALEAKVTDPDLSSNRLLFIFSALPHDEVMQKHKTFAQLLKTSCLAAIKDGQTLKHIQCK